MKLLKFILGFLIILGLTACQDNKISIETLTSNLSLVYSGDDHKDSVTSHILLPTVEIENVTILWSSSHEQYARIDDDRIIITRPLDQNQEVTITADVTWGQQKTNITYTFTVIKAQEAVVTYRVYVIDGRDQDVFTIEHGKPFEHTPIKDGYVFDGYYINANYQTPWNQELITQSIILYVKWIEETSPDTEAPVIIGAKDIYVSIGETINYVLGITVTDNVDENPTLTYDDSEVNLNLSGVYTLIYIARDASQNESIITVFVYVESELDMVSPTILGTKDIYITIGETVDYLYGVSVSDDKDPHPHIYVDDSEVDIYTAGIYSLYYLAIDASENETFIEVKVHVENIELSSVIETFDSVSGSSSSYTNGQFTGVSGIQWSFSGMRNDQTLDGKAITFGQSTTQYLRAIINFPVTKISVTFEHAFTGSSVRKIDLYINNIFIKTFEVGTGKVTLSADNLALTGTNTVEFRNASGERVTLDNITFYQEELSQTLKNIDFDIKNLVFPQFIIANQEVTLQTVGQRGSTITYAFAEPNNPNNAYINLSTGNWTIPVDTLVNVDIKITFTLDNEQKTITKTVTLGEGEPITIQSALLTPGLIKTRGTLTGYVVLDTYIRGFLQDQTHAMEVRFSLSQLSELEIGRSYVIKGSMNLNTSKYLDKITWIDPKTTNTMYASVLSDKLSDQLNHMVYFSGLMKRDYTSGDAYIIVDDRMVAVSIKDTHNPFVNQKLGSIVNIIGHVVYEQGVYKIWVLDAEDVEFEGFDSLVFEDFILFSLDLDRLIITQTDVTLKTTDPLFQLSISWSSSMPSVISTTGKVSSVDEETLVKLTYVVSNGSTIIFTGTIDVIVIEGVTLTGYYQDANGKTGTALLTELTRIISRNYSGISYKATNAVLEKSDKHPSGQGYLGVYDHISITSYNKEHVWPQSSFNEASPYVSDMHHLRISLSSTNSTRSNYYFNDPTSPSTKWQVGTSRFFPGDLDKGDIARILMYMAVRYRNDNFRLIVAQSGRTSNAPSRTLGNLAVLYRWHVEDPVDNFEKNRNEIIFGTQKNRNPFIDHPELFEEIWQIFMAEDQQRKMSYSFMYEDLVNLVQTLDDMVVMEVIISEFFSKETIWFI